LIQEAIAEDIGGRDITTESIVPPTMRGRGRIVAKEDFIVCGIGVCASVFRTFDPSLRVSAMVRDGAHVAVGTVLLELSGRCRSILTAERVALNFLSLLSAVATKTQAYVARVRPFRVKIMDTRKTLPGLRELQKYAVRIGGGYNHRMRLDEMILIKDNHLAVAAPRLKGATVSGLLRMAARATHGRVQVEIEVKDLSECASALREGPILSCLII